MTIQAAMRRFSTVTVSVRPNAASYGLVLAMSIALTACSTTGGAGAPVESRQAPPKSAARNTGAKPANTVKLAAATEAPVTGATDASAKGVYHTVVAGDTLGRIARQYGQKARDIAVWNRIDNPDRIEVGQVLRVQSSAVAPAATVAAKSPAAPSAEPVPSGSSGASSAAAASPKSAAASSAVAPVAPGTAPKSESSGTDYAHLDWEWPVSGAVLSRFGEGKNNGILLDGAAGSPVHAAFEGRVIYAGNGLRGYGNLVIIKHNNDFLTAYGHNRRILVKVDEAVQKGQAIAEMGDTESSRVQLHFELRLRGKPVDPLLHLPAR